MKVLLAGEFSGLHKYLKEGLLELGDEVTFIADGDGWKKISGADKVLNYPTKKNLFSQIYNRGVLPYFDARQLKGYDIVQLMHQRLYNDVLNDFLVKTLISGNLRSFVLSAGDDVHVVKDMLSGKYKYSVCDDNPKLISKYKADTIRSKFIVRSDNEIDKKVDGIIPMSYEYFEPHKNNPKCTSIILFPINHRNILYKENEVKDDKIVIFHGLNREEDKGTSYIRAACEKIQEEYKNEVEIIIKGKMPFDEYCEVMSKTNIVIDQCKSYGYGINACIAMAQGKVVMSGAEQVYMDMMKIDDCPIINIEPNEDDIVNKLRHIIENKRIMPELGYQGRLYVENRHDYIKVAQEFKKNWMKYGG